MDYFPRELEKQILELWNEKRFFVIIGPRRVGKTTLLKRLQELKGGTYITFESINERKTFLRDPLGYVKDIGDDLLFFDEVQLLGKEGARALKLVYDESEVKVILSGSGAFDVKIGLSSSLAGRAYFFPLLPLSFKEFLQWRDKRAYNSYMRNRIEFSSLRKEKLISYENELLKSYFEEYCKFGSYPEVVLKDNEKAKRIEIENISSTIIEGDIIKFFSLREGDKLISFSQKIAASIGNIIHLSSFGIDHRTAEQYLSILKRSFIVETISPFYENKFKELSKARKVYFYDLGFRNSLVENFSSLSLRADVGEIVENFVLTQLIHRGEKEVNYWRSKSNAEVDFVINRGKIAIEVKAGNRTTTKSLLSFIDKYNPEIAIVITNNPFEKEKGETKIYGIPPYYL